MNPVSRNGALLINKSAGISSFGVIEVLQRQLMERDKIKRRDLPKLGHGGTLDPFATGLLLVCAGRGVKLARYFLGSDKGYEGRMRFGETTVPGDPTSPVSERSEHLPDSLEQLRSLAQRMTLQPYLQTPPMHSAKKKDGKPLYELARAGIEVEREAKTCHLRSFEIDSYEKPCALFRLLCSSGTYVRSLSQDFARLMETVGMLDTLHRVSSGPFHVRDAWTTDQIGEAIRTGASWEELPCWVPFDRLLEGYPRASATPEEAQALFQGKQTSLFNILKRAEPVAENDPRASHLAIYCANSLIAVACHEHTGWRLERVFTR